jgi:hypothetical protein
MQERFNNSKPESLTKKGLIKPLFQGKIMVHRTKQYVPRYDAIAKPGMFIAVKKATNPFRKPVIKTEHAIKKEQSYSLVIIGKLHHQQVERSPPPNHIFGEIYKSKTVRSNGDGSAESREPATEMGVDFNFVDKPDTIPEDKPIPEQITVAHDPTAYEQVQILRGVVDMTEPIKSPFDLRFEDLKKEDNEAVIVLWSRLPHLDANVDLAAGSTCPVIPESMETLSGPNWLNDEVINCYSEKLQRRKAQYKFFTTHFMSRLLDEGSTNTYKYDNVKRWTKHLVIGELEKVFIPINCGGYHWTLIVITINAEIIHISYYDSLNGNSKRFVSAVQKWLKDEGCTKKSICQVPGCPKQQNGFDCGVFCIMNMDFLSDNLPLRYKQCHIPMFRKKIAAAIVKGTLNY